MPVLTITNSFTAYTKIKSSEMNANFANLTTLLNTTLLDDTNIQNAGITRATKLKLGTASHVIINDGTGAMSSEAQLAGTRGGSGVSNAGTLTWGASNVTFTTSGATGVTLPTSGTLATLAGTEALTNKTIGNTNTVTLKDTLFTLQDDGDATKLVAFQLSGITTGNTRTLTVPDASLTLVGTATTQTLTNKTISTTNNITGNESSFSLVDSSDPTKVAYFVMSSITTGNNRAYTLPNASGTLDMVANTATLSNKTLGITNTVTLTDDKFTLQDDGNVTRQGTFQLSGITAGNTRVLTWPDVSTTIVGTDATQTLTNKSIVASQLTGAVATTNGGTNLTTYTTGDTLYASASNTLSKLAVGTTGQVLKIAGGIPSWAAAPTGGINYLSVNSDAETDTTGWTTYADAPGVYPVDGTGGSPVTTWTRSTSSPLRGAGSFIMTRDGTNRQGEGVGYAFTLDNADLAKPLSITFDYKIVSGTFTASDGITAQANSGTATTAGNSTYQVFVYDVTNSALIPVSPNVLTSNSTTIPATFKGTFQTSATGTSYRLIIHTSYLTAAANVVMFDNLYLGPQAVAYGAAVSDWEAWTPTGSWSANTTYTGFKRRVGDMMECQVKVVCSGAPTSASLTINMPTGFTIDTAKLIDSGIPSSNPQDINFGIATIVDLGVQTYGGYVAYNSSSSVGVYIGNAASTSLIKSGAVTQAVPMTFGNTDMVNVRFSIPISGWSSTTLMSNDTDTRVVAAKYTSSTSTVGTSDATCVFPTLAYDTHGAYNSSTGVYTVPVSGYYRVSIETRVTSLTVSGANRNIYHMLNKNGSNNSFLGEWNSQASVTGGILTLSGSTIVQCIAGDTLTPVSLRDTNVTSFSWSGGASTNHLEIERLTGPATIAATENVSLIVNTTATTPSTSFTTLSFSTTEKDSHGGYSAGTYTVPIAGSYFISAGCMVTSDLTVGQAVQIAIHVNGTQGKSGFYRATGTQAGFIANVQVSAVVKCVAGDLITIKALSPGANRASNSSANYEFFTLDRIGN